MNLKFIISLLVLFIYTFFKTKKSFHMLQQNWYNEGLRYIKWMVKNKKQVFRFALLSTFRNVGCRPSY